MLFTKNDWVLHVSYIKSELCHFSVLILTTEYSSLSNDQIKSAVLNMIKKIGTAQSFNATTCLVLWQSVWLSDPRLYICQPIHLWCEWQVAGLSSTEADLWGFQQSAERQSFVVLIKNSRLQKDENITFIFWQILQLCLSDWWLWVFICILMWKYNPSSILSSRSDTNINNVMG